MKYTKEELTAALKDADSMKEIMVRLEMKINSGNYSQVRKFYREAGIEMPTSFPRRKQFTHGSSGFNRLPDHEFFSNNVGRSGSGLRERMIHVGVVYQCSSCGILDEWNGSKLTLQVDHIDGDRFNNQLDNLRFLCPNCHAQTDTWGRTKTKQRPRYNYCHCGDRIGIQAKTCIRCRVFPPRPTKIDWPPLEEVLRMVEETSLVQVGKALGVSATAVKKYIKREAQKIEGDSNEHF